MVAGLDEFNNLLLQQIQNSIYALAKDIRGLTTHVNDLDITTQLTAHRTHIEIEWSRHITERLKRIERHLAIAEPPNWGI